MKNQKSMLAVDMPHCKVLKNNGLLQIFFRHSEGGYSSNVPVKDDPQGRLAVLLLASDAEAGKFILTGQGMISEEKFQEMLNGPKQLARDAKLIEMKVQ